jgi:hypothetical protein
VPAFVCGGLLLLLLLPLPFPFESLLLPLLVEILLLLFFLERGTPTATPTMAAMISRTMKALKA